MDVIAILINLIVLPAPIWVSIAFLFVERKTAVRFTWIAFALTIGALVFSMMHASDRDPLQWPSAFAFMAAFWLLVSAGIARVVRSIRSMWWPNESPSIGDTPGVQAASDNPYEPPHA